MTDSTIGSSGTIGTGLLVNTLKVTSPTESTSTTTGALQVVGGTGIGGNVTVGKKVKCANVQITAGSAAGLVLHSDADGNGEWLSDPGTDLLNSDNTWTNRNDFTQSYAAATDSNTLFGFGAGNSNNLTSTVNTAFGFDALGSLSTAPASVSNGNTAVGYKAGSDIVNGANMTAVGYNALTCDTVGNCTAVGARAGQFQCGTFNTYMGSSAGVGVTSGASTGTSNTGIGYTSLAASTTGSSNTATGFETLLFLDGGSNNTVAGYRAGRGLHTANNNVAMGFEAMYTVNNIGIDNVHVGMRAGKFSTAAQNVFVGRSAGEGVGVTNDATNCVGVGYQSLTAITSGNDNVGVGSNSLVAVTTGAKNTSIGSNSLRTSAAADECTALGYQALYYSTGSDNTSVGSRAGKFSTGDSNVFVGMCAGSGAWNTNTAINCVGIGIHSLEDITSGDDSVGVGANALAGNTSGASNVAVGSNALGLNLTGDSSTAIGYCALCNSTAGSNVAVGKQAGYLSTTGIDNTYIGTAAGVNCVTGSNNTAVGSGCLGNTTAGGNTAVGYLAGSLTTSGSENVSMGVNAMRSNVTGSSNTAIGDRALFIYDVAAPRGYSTCIGARAGEYETGERAVIIGADAGGGTSVQPARGTDNVIIGVSAMNAGINGDDNVVIGSGTAASLTDAHQSVIIGMEAAPNLIDGDSNTIIGYQSGSSIPGLGMTTGVNNTVVGAAALFGTTALAPGNQSGNCMLGVNNVAYGNNNVIIGMQAISGNTVNTVIPNNNNIVIGYQAGITGTFAITNESNQIVLGNSAITHAHLQVTWTIPSDVRDKTDISFLDINKYGLDIVTKMQPIAFRRNARGRYAEENDGSKKDHHYTLGFSAQQMILAENEAWGIDHKYRIINQDNPDKLGIQSDNIIPLLVNAVKALELRIQQLESNHV